MMKGGNHPRKPDALRAKKYDRGQSKATLCAQADHGCRNGFEQEEQWNEQTGNGNENETFRPGRGAMEEIVVYQIQ